MGTLTIAYRSRGGVQKRCASKATREEWQNMMLWATHDLIRWGCIEVEMVSLLLDVAVLDGMTVGRAGGEEDLGVMVDAHPRLFPSHCHCVIYSF